MEYVRINENTYRMIIPYKDIFTTVYVVKTDAGALLFDSATTESDVKDHIVPMLDSLGIGKNELKYVFISHNHGDHAGGVPYLAALYPSVTVLTRSEKLIEAYPSLNVKEMRGGDIYLDCLTVFEIPGHSLDSSAIFDSRTKTLITGDSRQLYGIFGSQDWGSNIALAAEHLAALTPLYSLGAEEVHTAHDFHPYGICYIGTDAIRSALDACREPIMNMCALIKANPDKSDAELREIYNASANIPPVREGVFRLMREEIREGKL
jgi:glyoxylase-like metal-dependent hydrolase (beta-lactamase superfamily II)